MLVGLPYISEMLFLKGFHRDPLRTHIQIECACNTTHKNITVLNYEFINTLHAYKCEKLCIVFILAYKTKCASVTSLHKNTDNYTQVHNMSVIVNKNNVITVCMLSTSVIHMFKIPKQTIVLM